MSDNVPTIGEIRRAWGIRVDTHRREDALKGFDTALKNHVEEAVAKSLKKMVTTLTVEDGIYIHADDVSEILRGVIDNV